MAIEELDYRLGSLSQHKDKPSFESRRDEAIVRAKKRIEAEGGEAGDSFPACTGKCPTMAAEGSCEFCERHVLQLDGSWVVQTLE